MNGKAAQLQRLRDHVTKHHGAIATDMQALRSVEGVKRLGPRVIDELDVHLALVGLGHIPERLPVRSRNSFVVLYEIESPVGELIQSLLSGRFVDPHDLAKSLAKFNDC